MLVPIIHSEADLGSLAPQIKGGTKAVLGAGGWRSHQKAVAQFWRQITKYFEKKKIRGWYIFQDGLMVGGKTGLQIIRKGAEGGSGNHQLVLELLKRGAVLERTEDARLLEKEYRLVKRIVKGTFWGRIFWSLWYKLHQESLLEARDKFIAERIDKTLKPKEKGTLFIGAYHNVERYLPKDIQITKLKDPKIIRSYYRNLVAKEGVASFEKYLTRPIKMEET